MTILVVCVALSSIGFGGSLAALLWMSIILCTVIGMMKREPPFGMVLNHWDETFAYAALFSLVSFFNHSVPVLETASRNLNGSYEIAILFLSNSYLVGKTLGA